MCLINDDNPFTAYIGIDWADTKHDACLQAAGSEQREFTSFPHQVDRIEAWAQSMHQRFGGPIAVVLELSKGPIVYALQKYAFFVLFPANPSMLAKYRQAFTPSRAKDDPTDAELALDLLIRHPGCTTEVEIDGYLFPGEDGSSRRRERVAGPQDGKEQRKG